jgi:hypothetical protein
MLATPGGADSPPALRRLNTPRPVQVQAAAGGAPCALLRNGQRLAVAEVLDHYRTDDRWWTAEPVSRSYYELLLDDGRTVTVFRDDASGGWYEQRYG